MIKISDSQIMNLGFHPKTWVEWVREAFLLKSSSDLPHKISQVFNNGRNFINTMPAIIPTINRYGVKIVSRYPERTPAVQGDLLLYDLKNGELLSMMDATYITASRTGAVAALAAFELKCSSATKIAVMGLGATGMSFLHCFTELPNTKKMIFKLLRYKNHAEKAADWLRDNGIENIVICENEESLIRDSDIVVSAVTVAENLIAQDEWFKSGVLVIPIHTRGFQNCDLFFDRVIADDKNHVSGFRYFDQFNDFVEFSDVLSGKFKGRLNDSERLLAYNIGIAMHDVYIANQIYKRCVI